MDLRSQLTLDHGDENMAYASKDQIDQSKQVTERLCSESINESSNQTNSREKDKPQSSSGNLRKSTNIVNGGNKYNNNRTLNSIQSKSTHHGGSNTAGSNTESNNTAGSNELQGQPAEQIGPEPSGTDPLQLPGDSAKSRQLASIEKKGATANNELFLNSATVAIGRGGH